MAKTSTSIKPGEVRNPHGRSKSDAARLRTQMRDAICASTYPVFDDLVNRLHKLALEDNDLNAFRMIFEYCLGRPFVQKEPESRDDSVTIFVNVLVSQLQTYGDKIPLETIKFFKEAVLKAVEFSQMAQLKQADHDASQSIQSDKGD